MAAFSLRGYWRTFSERMACTPAMTIKRLTTIARTGRRMKRSVNLMRTPFRFSPVYRRRRDFGLGSELVVRSEEHTSELQSQSNLVCRLLLEKKKTKEVRRQTS